MTLPLTNQNNVIYIDSTYWYTLLMYRQSIKFMKDKDPIKYKIALEKETAAYKSLLKDCIPANDNEPLCIHKAA
jgi:hypothetical protein